MSEKKAEDMFTDGGEYNPAALRGAFEKWLGRDWTLVGDSEVNIKVRDDQKEWVMCFRDFEAWLNGKVDDDWYKDVKETYGNEEPKQVFKGYWENNQEFRESVRDHIVKVTIGGKPGTNNSDSKGRDGSSDSDDSQNEGQSSFGESRFPELHDIGVVNDSGNFVNGKLKGLVVAFVKDVDEIRGEDREFRIKWAQRAFLYWGKEKFDEEWMEKITDHVHDGLIYEVVEYVYNNHDEGNELMHKKYRGNYDLEVGNPDTDDVSKSFLDTEVPGWDEDDDEDDPDPKKSKWENFEEEAQEKYGGDDNVEGDNSDSDKDGSADSDSGGINSDRSSSGDGSLDGSSGGPLSSFAEEHGTTDEVHSPSRTREGHVSTGTETKQQSVADTNGGRQTAAEAPGVECEDWGRPYPIEWPEVEPMDELERNKIYEGNTFEWALKLPTNSVDTMVTSPPYYNLRDYDIEDAVPISGDFTCDHQFDGEYCMKCGAFLGQLGAEQDPATFVEHIVDLMDRYKRVLKPTGSLWLNIGDTYAGKNFDGRVKAGRKSRMMIPERVYRRMVQTGWHMRDYVVWVKKVWMPDDDLRGNGKPFAGSSRLADQWEPMARFTPKADHYSDVDSNRLKPPSFDGDLGTEGIEGKFREGEDTQRGKTYNELGTNPPDVWLINSDGYDGDHRAVFPEDLPARCINITTPDRVCGQCGKPYEKEVHIEDDTILNPGGDYATYDKQCRCDADHKPGIAFDPFLGSGTTGVAAANNGFDWAGVELSEKYAELARERIPTGRQIGLSQW